MNTILTPEQKKLIRVKVDEAIAASEHTPPIDGKILINNILKRFQKKPLAS